MIVPYELLGTIRQALAAAEDGADYLVGLYCDAKGWDYEPNGEGPILLEIAAEAPDADACDVIDEAIERAAEVHSS